MSLHACSHDRMTMLNPITSQAQGVTRERLASYDRPIRDEPDFSAAQAPGLRRDLAEYLKTLKVTLDPVLRGHLQSAASGGSPLGRAEIRSGLVGW